MTDQPMLTIFVPTYNRASELQQCLTSFLLEPEPFKDGRCELIVSNNVSTDHTRLLMEQTQAAYPFLKTIDRQDHLDAESHIVQGYGTGTGRYVWVFGDDDVVLPGALMKILEQIAEREPGSFFLNRSVKDANMVQFYTPSLFQNMETKEYPGMISFLGEVGYACSISFISSVIVRRDLIQNADFTPWIGYWDQFTLPLTENLSDDPLYFFSEPMLIQRQGNQQTTADELTQLFERSHYAMLLTGLCKSLTHLLNKERIDRQFILDNTILMAAGEHTHDKRSLVTHLAVIIKNGHEENTPINLADKQVIERFLAVFNLPALTNHFNNHPWQLQSP